VSIRRSASQPVPRDALVAGFDDIPAASWAAYDLTTFVQDGARMVDEADGHPERLGGVAPAGGRCTGHRAGQARGARHDAALALT
jgi:hypothetical protein